MQIFSKQMAVSRAHNLYLKAAETVTVIWVYFPHKAEEDKYQGMLYVQSYYNWKKVRANRMTDFWTSQASEDGPLAKISFNNHPLIAIAEETNLTLSVLRISWGVIHLKHIVDRWFFIYF